MSTPALSVLFEDNHLLVVDKPANLPTIGVAPGEQSLANLAKRYIKEHYSKPGNVYLGVMSRLDSLVTGVVVLARTSKAAARLTEQFKTRQVEKTYWAIVAGRVPERGDCVDHLAKDDRRARVVVVSALAPGAQEARLAFRRLGRLAAGDLVEIELLTGRKHQIRVQMASRGWPILGDNKYGGPGAFGPGIALHSRRLRFQHPVGGAELAVEAPAPGSWPAEARRER